MSLTTDHLRPILCPVHGRKILARGRIVAPSVVVLWCKECKAEHVFPQGGESQ